MPGQKNVDIALGLADNMLKRCGNITESTSTIDVNATNQFTKETPTH